MKLKEKFSQILTQYMPQQAVNKSVDEILKHQITLKITKERQTKLGDYRHPQGQAGHKISVNATLNPYAFLITFVHELAHLYTWIQFKNKVKPHGEEWKQNFRNLMNAYNYQTIFPDDIYQALKHYLQNPLASTTRHNTLTTALNKYDQQPNTNNNTTLLELIEDGQQFLFKNHIYKKISMRRQYALCLNLTNNKQYLVRKTAKVSSIND